MSFKYNKSKVGLIEFPILSIIAHFFDKEEIKSLKSVTKN